MTKSFTNWSLRDKKWQSSKLLMKHLHDSSRCKLRVSVDVVEMRKSADTRNRINNFPKMTYSCTFTFFEFRQAWKSFSMKIKWLKT